MKRERGRESRKDTRFGNMGRVESPELCPLPGVLDDISLTGCRVHFPIPVTVDTENDYPLKVKLSSHGSIISLDLICHPQWKNEVEGGFTEIGFSILRSPDTPELNAFISQLSVESKDDSDISDLLIETPVTFIE